MELKEAPLFSIIIPVYNAIETLNTSIESILSQTYDDWELILIDDCSSDNSFDICEAYALKFPSIRCVKMPNNSGNAKKPRDIGIQMAKGQYIICVDSDDEIATDYLEIMTRYIVKEQADVVLPKMWKRDINSDGHGTFLPEEDVAAQGIISGKSACLLTIPDWQICCGGMAFRREYYKASYEQNPYYYINSDEYTSRLLLNQAARVAFTNAIYIYWQYPSSITHKESSKLFERLLVDRQICVFFEQRYTSNQIVGVFAMMLKDLISLQKRFYRNINQYPQGDVAYINRILKESFTFLQTHRENFTNIKDSVFIYNYNLFKVWCYFNK